MSDFENAVFVSNGDKDSDFFVPDYLINYFRDPNAPGTQLIETNPLIGVDAMRAQADFSHIDGSGYAVAILDTGIDLDHEAFAANDDGDAMIVYHHDFSDDGDGTVDDVNGHGTHVAGTAAGNSATHKGIAPNADIVALQVLGNSGSGSGSDILAALEWVRDNHATYNIVAVNMSLGAGDNQTTPQTDTYYSAVLEELADAGVIVVASNGNDYKSYEVAGASRIAADVNTIASAATWDKSYSGTMTWGDGAQAINPSVDTLTPFSQRSDPAEFVSIAAPGAFIDAPWNDGTYAGLTGTSMSAPVTTGAVVLIQQMAEEMLGFRLTVAEVETLLALTGVPIHDVEQSPAEDNVLNLGHVYPRVDINQAAIAIRALSERKQTAIDMDEDGKGDLLFQKTGNGAVYALDGDDAANNWIGVFGSGARELLGVGDLDGDGHTDLVWQRSDGVIFSQQGEVGTGAWGKNFGLRDNHELLAIVDLDNDDKEDLLLRDLDNNNVYGLDGDEASNVWNAYFGAQAHTFIGMGDLDANGDADVVWQRADGVVFSQDSDNWGGAWQKNFGQRDGETVLAIADFDNDAGDDLLIQKDANGQTYILDGDAAGNAWQGYLGAKPTDTFLGIGDLNADFQPDVIWQRADGVVYSQNTTTWGGAWQKNFGPRDGQEVLGIGDVDGDGGLDLIFRNTSSGATYALDGDAAAGNGWIGYYGAKSAETFEGLVDLDGDGTADLLWSRPDDLLFTQDGEVWGSAWAKNFGLRGTEDLLATEAYDSWAMNSGLVEVWG